MTIQPYDIEAELRALELELHANAPLLATPPATGAERMRKQRTLDKAEGVTRDKRTRRGRGDAYDSETSLFRSGVFIGIDGEGVSEGPSDVFRSKSGKRKLSFTAQEHFMMLLAASTGETITCDTGRLSAQNCLDFLIDVQAAHPKSILVCYGGSYDVNQMLLYDLSMKALRHISAGARVGFVLGGQYYRVEYRARKCLTVKRWPGSEPPGYVFKIKRDGSIETVEEPCEARAVLWDTIGFFQASFAETMENWLGGDHPDLAFIRRMKADRGLFVRAELAEMIVYNAAECRALVAIMDKLREAVVGLGLTLRRFDGAGAVASSMNTKHEVKLSKAVPPDDVFEAARHAFSGGHIETMKVGTFDQVIHHYDVSSAYPSIIQHLPALSEGVWSYGQDANPPAGFTVVEVQYEFAAAMPFYPLFFRHEDGSITYPQHGKGWYWFPEFNAARDFAAQHGAAAFTVTAWHHFEPSSDARPFGFVPDYYNERKRMIAKVKAGKLTVEDLWEKGGEYIIKLGLNSLYGKTSQQVGGRGGEPPPYFQLEWAGYITAGTRAQLMRAAMLNPAAIISFATDGIFSIEPLDLHCPREKELGTWEYQTHAGMVIAMPGVYWLYDPEDLRQPIKAKSRGFDKASVATPAVIMHAWQDGKTVAELPMRRLVTMGSACMGTSPQAMLWRARGRFLVGVRLLKIDGSSVKRAPPRSSGRAAQLWRESAATSPRPNASYLDWLCEPQASRKLDDPRASSCAYAIAWLDDEDTVSSYEDGRLESMEEMDAEDNLG